jgi:hypothetical protein
MRYQERLGNLIGDRFVGICHLEHFWLTFLLFQILLHEDGRTTNEQQLVAIVPEHLPLTNGVLVAFPLFVAKSSGRSDIYVQRRVHQKRPLFSEYVVVS